MPPDLPSADRLQEILDGLTEAVCRFRPDGTILYANQAYCRLFGLEPGHIVGASYAPIVHPDDLERVQRQVDSMSPSQPAVVIENRIVLPSGEVRWTQWTNRGFFDADGRMIEVQAAGRDITDRVVAEQRLARSNDRFRFLADASAELAGALEYETALDHVVRMAVPFLADSCTVSLIHEGVYERVAVAHVDATVEEALREQARRMPQESLSTELRALVEPALRGEPILVERFGDDELEELGLDEDQLRLSRLQQIHSFMLVPLLARRHALGVMSFVASRAHSRRTYDADDLALAVELGRRAGLALDNARLMEELREADHRKDRFLATLAHELRNPMAALLGAVETLRQPGVDPTVRDRALEVAGRQVRHQARLVEDLLDVSRLTRGTLHLRRQPVDVAPLVRDAVDVLRPLAEQKGQRIVVTVGGPALVSGDPARISQIVGNLVDNAIRYTQPGGGIRVALSVADDVAVRVVDEGPGIPEDIRRNVFEAFVQGSPVDDAPSSGLGLGLTLARELVELHGGTIDIEVPETGRGTALVVRLPRADQPARASEPPKADSTRPHLRVLVVDDNADAADMVAALLRAWGHEAREVYDGRTALDTVSELDPDLIFVDIGMPGMDGYETARELRRRPAGSRARLVALTGYAQPSDLAAALEAGFDRHVAKPVDAAILRRVLDEVVRA